MGMHIPIFGNGDIDSPEKALEYRNKVEERYNTSQDFLHNRDRDLGNLFAPARLQIQYPRLIASNDAGDCFSSAYILREKRHGKTKVLREGDSSRPLRDGHRNSNVGSVIENR